MDEDNESTFSHFSGNKKLLSTLSAYRLKKHLEIRQKLVIETKLDTKTLEDRIIDNFRNPSYSVSSYKKSYDIEEPGKDLPATPLGCSSPIVSRRRMSPSKRLTEYPSSPTTEHRSALEMYTRSTSRYFASEGSIFKSALHGVEFKHPLNVISFPRPSRISSGIDNANLPTDADYILSGSKLSSIATVSRKFFVENTPLEDRRYICLAHSAAAHRPTTVATHYSEPFPGAASSVSSSMSPTVTAPPPSSPSVKRGQLGALVRTDATPRTPSHNLRPRSPAVAHPQPGDLALLLDPPLSLPLPDAGQLVPGRVGEGGAEGGWGSSLRVGEGPQRAPSSPPARLFPIPPVVAAAPLRIDFSLQGSPDRTKRPICKKKFIW